MITKEEVAHIAFLARIGLSDRELDQFTGDMSSVLEMVQNMHRCPMRELRDSEPVSGVLRADEVRAGLTRQQLLRAASLSTAGCYVVPKTVEAE